MTRGLIVSVMMVVLVCTVIVMVMMSPVPVIIVEVISRLVMRSNLCLKAHKTVQTLH
jgi:hypothetical protein